MSLTCFCLIAVAAIVFFDPSAGGDPSREAAFRVLVFSKTEGFRHGSIPEGIEAVKALGREHGLEVKATEEAAEFTEEGLRDYAVVVFLNTTGTVFDEAQREAFQAHIRSGGGYVGIHSAADTEYDWPWYREFDGGRTWYTGGGHTGESYGEPAFREHLLGGILWAAGEK